MAKKQPGSPLEGYGVVIWSALIAIAIFLFLALIYPLAVDGLHHIEDPLQQPGQSTPVGQSG